MPSQACSSPPPSLLPCPVDDWDGKKVLIFGKGGRICVIMETGQVVTGYKGGTLDATNGKTIVDEFILRTPASLSPCSTHIPPGTVAFQVAAAVPSPPAGRSGTGVNDGKCGRIDRDQFKNKDKKNNSYYYLTVPLYGGALRQEMTETLQESLPKTLPILDVLSLVVDYTVGRATNDDNAEGSGFNYLPMKATTLMGRGTDARQQFFTLRANQNGVEESGNTHSGAPAAAPTGAVATTRRGNGNHTKNTVFEIQSLFGTYWRSHNVTRTISQAPHDMKKQNNKNDTQWIFQPITDTLDDYGGNGSDEEDGWSVDLEEVVDW